MKLPRPKCVGFLLMAVVAAFAGIATGTADDRMTTDTADPAAAGETAGVEWDLRTLTLIQREGVYGRIIRLRNGQMLCAYDFKRKLWVRHSRDEGKSWEEPVLVADWPHGTLTNAELLQLRDGTVLCFYNERPDQAPDAPRAGNEARPFTICLASSKDGGRSWGRPTTLYRGGTEFSNGCWEPAAVELPSGEVQLFFANESPYRTTNEQEITLLRSRDDARTWSAPERVSFRAGARDGMPVPLVLQNGRGIAVAIEDNGLSGNFKPVILFTTLQDNWRSGVIEGKSRRRVSALRTPLAPPVYAGAPYLRQMPSGETLLSFQKSDTGALKDARMVVCIGDANARNFASPSYPFPLTPGAAQLWNSLFVKDPQTVTAVSQTTIGGVTGLWSVEGRLVKTSSRKTR